MGSLLSSKLFFGFPLDEDYNEIDIDEVVEERVGISSHLFFKETGCEIDYCGYSNYSDCFVKLTGNDINDFDGNCTMVDLDELDTTKEEVEKIRAFCKRLGIEYQEPKWYLTGYYG